MACGQLIRNMDKLGETSCVNSRQCFLTVCFFVAQGVESPVTLDGVDNQLTWV